jgi:phage terminase small subunit
MKKRPTKKQMDQVIKNSVDKIKKQGGSPSEISNKRKTVKKIFKDASKGLTKLSKQFGKNK